MEGALKELEEAARILLASPHQVTSEQRRQAEALFIDFRKTKSPFALCINILENTVVEYVLFQSAALLKESLTREWPTIPKSEIDSLRNYLTYYISNRMSLPGYVKEQIFQVIAVIMKRGSVDGDNSHKDFVFNEVSNLINSGNLLLQLNGCSILSAVMNEYSNTIKSSDVGLSWERHYHAKQDFEVTCLKRMFQFCLQVLNELEKCNELTIDYCNLLKRFLTITEQILSWNFNQIKLSKRMIGFFEAEQSPSLRPGANWRDIFLDSNVLELFFKIYWKIHNNDDLCPCSLVCITQLASLHGSIFPEKQVRINYLSKYIEEILKLMQNNLKPNEALGVSNAINKLISFYPPTLLFLVPKELSEAFVKGMTTLTCKLCHQAMIEGMIHSDNQQFSEALETMLDAWVLIFHDVNLFAEEHCQRAAIEILNAYIQCHLTTSEKANSQILDADVAEEIDETEESDRVKFKDQLSAIGILGRHSLEYTIPLLCRLLEDRVKILRQLFQSIHQQQNKISTLHQLHRLYEDLHWLTLIAGHIITIVNDGEPSMIPRQIMHYSLKHRATVSVDAAVSILTSSDMSSLQPALYEQCDGILRLVAAIFRLSETLLQAAKSKLVDFLSPEIASTLTWFFSRWCVSYLMLNESLYTEISPSIITAFGQDTPSSVWCLNFLLEHIDNFLGTWLSENQVVNETVNLFVTVVENKERASKLNRCESLWNIVWALARGDLDLLHPTAKRGLLKALVLVGSSAPDYAGHEQYWAEVLKPLQDKFKEIISQEKFSSAFHEENVRKEIIHLLDCFIGVVQGCNIYNTQYLFQFLHPITTELIPLISAYHNYPNVVIQVIEYFCECTKRMLCYLNHQNSKLIYEACVQMIQVYAKANIGKRNFEASAEEEQYQDLSFLMDILTDILSKDFIDCDSEAQDSGAVSSANVTLYALNIIMPLMTIELLQFPGLCLRYYKMITFVCEIYPEKICQLPEELFKNLIASLELGFTTFSSDITLLCLDFLTVLGTHMFKSRLKDNMVYMSTKHFLQVVFEMVLLQNMDSSLLYPSSGTLFALICCYQDFYQELVQTLLSKQTDPVYYERLQTSFNKLMEGIELNDARSSKIKFRENFGEFLANVRGFLCVK